MSWMTRSLVMVTMLGFAGAAIAADPAKKAAKGKEKPLRATVVSVEAMKLKIKPIAARKDASATASAEEVLATNDKTVVKIDGKDGKLADLKAGQRVVISMEKGAVTQVEAKAPARKARANKKPGKLKA